jgi:hypothetical protein
MTFGKNFYHPWVNRRSENRKPVYLLSEIADMVGIEHRELLSKITSSAVRGLPTPKVRLAHKSRVGNKRYYDKTDVINFLKEYISK